MAATLANLMKTRLGLMRKVVKLQPTIIAYNVDTIDLSVLELDKAKLEQWELSVETLHDDTFNLCATEAEFAKDHEPELETLQKAIKSLQSKVMIIIRTRKEKTATGPSPHFKLERVKLPQFNGNFAEWQSFRDLFVASVHKNSTLSGAEKMVHLKSCLTGNAASIVSSFQATEANYKEAWESVMKRYDSKKEIVFAHLKKYDDFPSLKVESGLGLRQLSDAINDCVRSLKAMKVAVDNWDVIIIYLAVRKLDPETRKQWSLEQEELAADLPDLDDFTTFIESRARALQDVKPAVSIQPAASSWTKPSSGYPVKKTSSSHAARQGPLCCPKCSKNHHLYQCKDFLSFSPAERRSFVLNNRLCFNCMFKGHSSINCPVQFKCKTCGAKHHTLLHENSAVVHPASEVTTSAHSQSKSETVVLLATLIASVPDSNGEKQTCRVFVDSGSESNFITENCVQRLRLKRKKTCVSVSGIGGVASESAKGLVNFSMHSLTTSFTINISALIYRKLTNNLLPRSQCKSSWPHLMGLQFSDPAFNVPSKIDILLGASTAGAILLPGLVRGPPNSPVAQLTQFGWILSGNVECTQTTSANHCTTASSSSVQVFSSHAQCFATSGECLEDSIERFWKLEEPVSPDRAHSSEDQLCEQHFVATHRRNPDGGYTVELPFRKHNEQTLGNSRASAVKRFLRLEARLKTNPAVYGEYVKGMREGIAGGLIEPVPECDLHKTVSETYYLPHREVVKESSTTTKVRTFYDASAKSSNGVSLNDCLMTGPKLQVDLVPLLIRFRSHLIAVSADIEKFYPQYKVDRKHVDFQRLIWRESCSEELRDYRLLRVTFGVTSAPYLAIRCLHQVAADEAFSHPLAQRVIKEDFLVDNLLSGSSNIASTLELKDEVLSVMDAGNLKLTKWSSNSPEIMQTLPTALRELNSTHTIDDSEVIRTIGLLWQPGPDTFSVSVCVPDITVSSSKRRVLSSIARIFDPLGWLSPVTIRLKILMQELWKLKCDWDSELPPALHKQWEQYCTEVPTLSSFKIDRCITVSTEGNPDSVLYELHGFCDASKFAYVACVYLRTIIDSNNSTVRLVLAKTRVAPVKTETIPRLELCSARLLATVINVVRESLHFEFSAVRCWTDSTIVLGWLTTSKQLPVFEHNRVTQIERLLPGIPWSHVPGSENPADVATRGISAASLIKNKLWLHGPEWLSSFVSPYLSPAPESLSVMSESCSAVQPFPSLISGPESCSAVQPFPSLISGPESYSAVRSPVASFSAVSCSAVHPFSGIVSNISNYNKMIRVAAYCLRFISICKSKNRQKGTLSVGELVCGLHHLIVMVQAEAFAEEIQRCKRKELLRTPLKFLCPFLDQKGVLRVGGRLQHSTLPIETQHPVLLPSKHNFVEQLIRHLHITHLHGGPQMLLAIIREKFWIVRGIDAVKRIVRRCVVCHRHSATPATQLMGQLPASRVNPSRAFSQCGVDYGGPFLLCLRPGRNPIIRKSYVSLFICMATRAIHLELVEDLSTAAFVAALTRFISRRGLPADIYSDGGTNFVGASNEVKQFQQFVQATTHTGQLSDFLASQGVQFHFNPPAAPHHGGLWEAGVKSMKHHLRRVTGERKLSMEEFSTLLCQVEACLNSRPLAPMSSSPNDYGVLTPGHFLIGSSLHALPQHDLTHLSINRLSRWQAVHQMLQLFWRRWSSEYVASLQNRPKWFSTTPNLDVGMLVLVRENESSLGPQKWNLGRISKVYPGIDDNTRVCDVMMPSGSTLKRPIVKLSPLPFYGDHPASDLLVSVNTNAGENVEEDAGASC